MSFIAGYKIIVCILDDAVHDIWDYRDIGKDQIDLEVDFKADAVGGTRFVKIHVANSHKVASDGEDADFAEMITAPGLGDGSFKGEVVDPGVFVYQCWVRLDNGRVVFFSGDVTLVK